MNIMKSSFTLFLTVCSATALASGLDSAQSIQSKSHAESASSQVKIDRSAEAAMAHKAEIEQLREELKNLEVYRDHLKSLVDSQQKEITSIDQQIDQIKYTRQGVVPLMYNMIDGLKTLVENDKPLRFEQRVTRIEKLEAMMPRADVSDAEKYRRILEAYQIELDYGTKLGLYRGSIEMSGTERIEADVLYLGRVSLIARNLAGNKYWSWDEKSQSWVTVDSSNKAELDKAYAIAAKQVAPSLIQLPVSLTVAEAK
ncbi:DUF3450 domain-containing protein [Vibrio sp. SCSIO 43135]|uniref:DUF3450 domain-containing protein n=1 Tax=Vibrio paucivorans TaxID=2829489 RepID=A0A9X3CI71_9VIBR|nr:MULTISPECIES: DUF3450 domain-containing protein [Vibrio]MCW8335240.1 DUF3450 domain-containing protein [Vibrio paucivorans]USD40283.1 DUF3450 domain-containing protein [Vibrio sp. SCSIO 43135]